MVHLVARLRATATATAGRGGVSNCELCPCDHANGTLLSSRARPAEGRGMLSAASKRPQIGRCTLQFYYTLRSYHYATVLLLLLLPAGGRSQPAVREYEIWIDVPQLPCRGLAWHGWHGVRTLVDRASRPSAAVVVGCARAAAGRLWPAACVCVAASGRAPRRRPRMPAGLPAWLICPARGFGARGSVGVALRSEARTPPRAAAISIVYGVAFQRSQPCGRLFRAMHLKRYIAARRATGCMRGVRRWP